MISLKNYFGKNIAVFGLGVTGVSVIHALKKGGANIHAWDDKHIPDITGVHFAHHSQYDWATIDELIISPGIPFKDPQPHEVVSLAQKHGCLISSDIDLLYVAQAQARFVGITGTNGKSTTTSLINHILVSNGIHSCIGGNIGIPVLDLVDNVDVYLLEMSSYQLDLCNQIHFDIGVLLNITPDHLDRHGNMANYIAAKRKIFGGRSVIGTDDQIGKESYAECVGEKTAFSTKYVLENGVSCVEDRIYKDGKKALSIGDNIDIVSENIAAAYVVCRLLGVQDIGIVEGMRTFKNLPHRMEFVRKLHNVTFVNDSKATNAVSAQQSLSKYKYIYWIAGGIAKSCGITNIDLTNVKQTFLIGDASQEFARTLEKRGNKYVISGTLKNAVREAYIETSVINEEVVILLAPACSSFDQWTNFEERGAAFKDFVAMLAVVKTDT